MSNACEQVAMRVNSGEAAPHRRACPGPDDLVDLGAPARMLAEFER